MTQQTQQQQRRQKLTASSSEVQAASLEAERIGFDAGETPGAVWRALARSVANRPGNAAVVHLLSHRGAAIRAAALHHSDVAARSLMRDILSLGPHTLVDAFSLRALQTGQSLVVPVISDDLFRLWVQPEFVAYLDAYRVTSLLVAPIRRANRRRGVVRVWREEPAPRFTHDERVYVQALVDGVVTAMHDRSSASSRHQERAPIVALSLADIYQNTAQ